MQCAKQSKVCDFYRILFANMARGISTDVFTKCYASGAHFYSSSVVYNLTLSIAHAKHVNA